MLNLSGQTESLLKQNSLRYLQSSGILRADGVAFRFTNHDSVLRFTVLGGTNENFTPLGSFDQSAQQKQADLNSNNRNLIGVLVSDKITNEDLTAGRYREAQINEYLVDWRFPFAPAVEIVKYWITSTTYSDDRWDATVEGIERWLNPSIGDRYIRNCRFRLGDANCGVDLDSVTSAATSINSVDEGLGFNNRTRFRITDSGFTSGYTSTRVRFGFVSWLTGNNAGLQSEIILDEISGSDVILTLAEYTPYEMQVGDTMTVTDGCDLLKATCRDKFSNIARHGGFPFVPTRDTQIRTPLAK